MCQLSASTGHLVSAADNCLADKTKASCQHLQLRKLQIDKKWVTEKQEKLPNHQTNKQIPVWQAKQTLRCQKLSSENKQAGKQINKCVTEKSFLHLHFG